MAAEQGGRFSSIEVPLLNDEKVYHVNSSNEAVTKIKEQQHQTVHVGNASLFKTGFHLVNAISGSFSFLLFLLLLLLSFIINHIMILTPY